MSSSIPQQIIFQCPFCDKKLRAPQKLAGKQLNCPKCNQLLEVPIHGIPNSEDPAAGSAPESATESGNAPLASNQPVPNGTPSTWSSGGPITGGSLFDDDLPELAPLVQSALQAESMGKSTPEHPSNKSNSSSSRKPISEGNLPPSISNTPSAPSVSSTPSVPPSPDVPDDDEFRLAPADATPHKPSGLPFDLAELTTGSTGPKSLDVSLDKLHLPGNALEVSGGKSREQEFWFSCKVCGTRLVGVPSKIGKTTQCTDCHTNVQIPPPKDPKAKQAPTITHDELAEVSFEPITAQSSKQPVTTKSQTAELLRKAKEESDAESDELDSIMVDFDTQKWLARLFWFLKDPQLIFIVVLMGAIASIWLAFTSALPEIFQIQNPRVAGVIQTILFVCPGIAFGAVLMSLGVCVVNMVANQYRLVQDWPFSSPGDVLGEVLAVSSAAAIAAAPGGMLGMVLATSTGSTVVMPFLTIASFWFLFPFVFLSISENGAITEPFSRNIYDSIRSKSDHWGAMYLQTMLAALVLFVLVGWATKDGQIGEVLLGLFLPFLVLFLFNQYGLLAGRISDVTGLNYTGDFSEDDADEE